jgi:hypothetical protein
VRKLGTSLKRKDFLKKACALGVAGGATAFACPGAAAEGRAASGRTTQEEMARRKFREAWIATHMKNMEEIVDPETRAQLMNANGRGCARRSSLHKTAEACRGDAAGFAGKVAGMVGGDFIRVEGNVVHWGYPRCYCEMVDEGPERLPASYCLCSAGWVQEMFETVTGRPVRVELVQSIKGGAPDCRFVVRL